MTHYGLGGTDEAADGALVLPVWRRPLLQWPCALIRAVRIGPQMWQGFCMKGSLLTMHAQAVNVNLKMSWCWS